MSTLAVERSDAVAWSPSHPAPPAPRPRRRVRVRRLGQAAIEADLSCALGAVLVAWAFAAAFLPEIDPGHSVATYWIAGLAGALCVVGSLLIHELGHALAARRAGLGVSRLTLSFVGGGSELVGAVGSARDALWIAIAGPLASVVTMLVAAAAHVALVETAGPGLPATVAALVASANLMILLVNAIPGLPFDGGRALAATVWALTRRPETAARLVSAVGRGVMHAMLGVAVLASAFGFVWIALSAGVLGFVLRES